MELDSLKDIWKDLGAKEMQQDNDEQILSMLQKRSRSPIAKMRRNLNWELIVLVVLYSLIIGYYIVGFQGRYWEVSVLMFIVGVFFLFYYLRKSKLLQQMQCVACEVKSSLQRQLKTLEKYVNFYFITGTLLTPIAYFLTGLIVFMKQTNSPVKTDPSPGTILTDSKPGNINLDTFSDHPFFIVFIVIGVALTIGTYFLNRWYVNRLYGRHIKKLKELLLQMEEV